MKEAHFVNREISWLSFNHRVLQEAKDPLVPLLERIKFLAIYSSNLDEFFRVRVASLRSLLDLKKKTKKKLKFDPYLLLKRIHNKVHKQQEEFGQIFRGRIIPELNQNNIFLINEKEVPSELKDFVENYFKKNVAGHLNIHYLFGDDDQIFLQNKNIYFSIKLLDEKKESLHVVIEIPTEYSKRFIKLPAVEDKNYIMFLDDIIRFNLGSVFPGHDIVECNSIKLTRDAELYIDDEFTGDLLQKIKKSLSKRKTGVPSRFLYDAGISEDHLKSLKEYFHLSDDDLIPGARYHNFNDFFGFPAFDKPELYYKPMPPLNCKELDEDSSIFNIVKKKDVFIHFPYQSYDYVLKFLNEAASDDSVKSIRLTLYRTASDSKVIKALLDAVKNGKSVTVFIEVKARFDEELNFQNAEELEKAGVNVLYSFPGLKVHSKICLVTRIEEGKKKHYAYLATGNFNEKTAKIYSDLGLFTSNEEITKEVRKIFNVLSKQKEKEDFSNLLVAPFNMRKRFNRLIKNEIKNASEGKKAFMVLKFNSLEDKKIIRKLYEASNAGVKIDIIVRGICCLVPGVKELSENIKVRSIVDRFLEHARVYIFHNNGDEQFIIASADWMRRNLSRRIELGFPVYDDGIKKILRDLIDIQLKDNVKARRINKTQTNPFVKSRSLKKTRAQYSTYDYVKGLNQPEVKISEVS